MTWRILPTRVPSDSGPLPIIPTTGAAPLHVVPSSVDGCRNSKITADQTHLNYFYTTLLHRTKAAHTLPSPSTLHSRLHRQSTPKQLQQRRIRLPSQQSSTTLHVYTSATHHNNHQASREELGTPFPFTVGQSIVFNRYW